MFSRVWKPEALALVSEIVLVNQLTTTRETRKQGRYSEGIWSLNWKRKMELSPILCKSLKLSTTCLLTLHLA